MEEETKIQVYADKIKLAAFFLTKEDLLVEYYSKVVSFIREQKMYDIEVISEQNEWRHFWEQFQQLFDLTKNDYLSNLEDEEQKQILAISDKYEDVKQELTFEEATIGKNIILKIMSGSGFHDVVRTSEDEDFK